MNINYAIDTTNYREQILSFPSQVEAALKLADRITLDKAGINKVCFLGMGGSGLAGDFLRDYLREEKLTILSVKDFDVPSTVDEHTLFFVISYSGNTEETIAAYRKITRFGSPIVVISSGGKLEQLVPMYKSQYIKIPAGLQPRVAVAYMAIPALCVLQKMGLVADRTIDMRNTVNALKKNVYEEFGKDLASKMGDMIPVIYASARYGIIPYKWKISFNENAKTFAIANTVPEADWTSYYYALSHATDPAPVEVIEQFKERVK